MFPVKCSKNFQKGFLEDRAGCKKKTAERKRGWSAPRQKKITWQKRKDYTSKSKRKSNKKGSGK